MTTTDPRPMRDYPCPHCGGVGYDAVFALGDTFPDKSRTCLACEGRGHFTRPILPRGAVRAFAVLNDAYGWWDDARAVSIIHATSRAKAKADAAYDWSDVTGHTLTEIFPHLRVRRAPEHDGEASAQPEGRTA